MTIKKYSHIAAATITAVFLTIGVLAGLTFNKVSFGGELQTSNAQSAELLADILPPPQYIIEPFLEVSQLMIDPRSVNDRKAKLGNLSDVYEERHQRWIDSNIPENMKTLLLQSSYKPAENFWNEVKNTFIPAIERGDQEAAARSYGRLRNDYATHREVIDKLVISVEAQAAALAEEAKSEMSFAYGEMIAISIVLLGAIAATIMLLQRFVINPLALTSEAMQKVAAGDYNAEVTGADRKDEIGALARSFKVFQEAAKAKTENDKQVAHVVDRLATGLKSLANGNLTDRINDQFVGTYDQLRVDFNAAMDEMASILQRVSRTADTIHTGSSEISAASDDLANRTEQQAASLEETAAAMDQVTGMVRGTAESAVEVNGAVSEAHVDAEAGGDVVKQAVEAMDGIERSSQEIAQIINVIDGIAFQTNLLALNAGVEAARAGDAGKGFAVVASEVRALAQRSAEAAKDIKALILTSSDQVENGVQLVGKTGDMLDRIVNKVGEIRTRITEISDSAETQAGNLQHVNSSVSDMDKMTQQNAAMVEESTAAARSLASEADQLSQLVSRFRLDAAGVSSRASATAPTADNVVMPAFPSRATKAPPTGPSVHGNLALNEELDDDDWTEF